MFEIFYEKLQTLGVIPTVILNDINDTLPLADALVHAGMPSAEITFRTSIAADVISNMIKNFPNMEVGAGTILNIGQAKQAIDAGAKYIVSPGYNSGIIAYCTSHNIPIIPGALTASEIMNAEDMGIFVTKFFPAKQFGGLSTIQSLRGPFSLHRFLPTGGINLNNLAEYLSDEAVIACGGTWMVKPSAFCDGDFSEVYELASKTMKVVRSTINVPQGQSQPI